MVVPLTSAIEEGVTLVSLHPKHWTVCRIEVGDRSLIAFADKRRILLWHPVSGAQHATARVKGPTVALCRVPHGGRELLASAGVVRRIRLWDPQDGREVARFATHDANWITGLLALPQADGQVFLASAGSDGAVVITDVDTGTCGYGSRVHWFPVVASPAFRGF
jgi:WD40 repeat protein